MKRKYLAVILSLSMVFSASSTAMAFSDEPQVMEEALDETVLDNSVVDESDISVFTEEDDDIEEDTEEYDATEDFQVSDIEEDLDFGDGNDTAEAVSTNETSEDGWTTSDKENKISFKYDEGSKTLYFRCSGTAEMPANIRAGGTSDWAHKLVDKTKEVEKVVIGEGITKIGENNFSNKENDWPNLKEVELASTVTTIGHASFYKAAALQTINLTNIEKIEQAGLAETGIEEALFGKEQVEIGGSAFGDCPNLKSVSVKDIINWGEASFSGCTKLTSFQCEKPVTKIPDSTFAGCSALSDCKLTGAEEVVYNAFDGCISLTSFDFSSVKYLYAMAFQGAGLTQIAFNSKDITIEWAAIACDNLSGICYPGTAEEWKKATEEAEVDESIPVHCKADTVEAKAATCTEAGWKEAGVCEVCGEHYSYPTDKNVIPALGHDFVSQVTKKATCTADGTLTYTCSRCGETKTETIKATGHKWSSWKRTAAATVFKPEVQTRKCSTCNKSESKNVGKKLTPKATVNASAVTLKVKQSTSGLRVTGLAKGDSVKSWKSSNRRIFTVSGKSNGTCKITGKKRGTAKLQITLASGLKKTVKVKVQTVAVKTSKITVSKNVTVRKGKRVTLKPVVTPFTSRQKVTYTSSNKKIATVSSKGVVTGKKKGTVKITVKSGNKSVKVTVRVK